MPAPFSPSRPTWTNSPDPKHRPHASGARIGSLRDSPDTLDQLVGGVVLWGEARAAWGVGEEYPSREKGAGEGHDLPQKERPSQFTVHTLSL
jgi:hypothetical protein